MERGEADLAWIGWLDPESQRIVPVAYSGSRHDMLSQLVFYVDERPEGHGNPGRAIREGKPFVCNRCAGGECLYPRNLSPAQFGFQSAVPSLSGFKGRFAAL